MRRCIFLLLLAVLALAPASMAQAERRVALVIGNGAYSTAPLKNPTNDARDMAAALKGLGFEVILRENAGLRQMEDALDEFWASLRKGGTGLFFFAGHGLQVKGVNYLVPVDARISVEQDVKSLCLDANRVLGRMENAGNGLNIVLLDACRNNPFARSWRSADSGLAKMDAPTGTLIGYATAPDSVAADGTGRNGVYTQHLLREMRVPGQTIENAMKKVRIGVLKDTNKAQTPWESSSLTGDFYFSGGAQQASLGSGASAPPPPAATYAAPPPPAAKPLDLKAEKKRLADEAAQLKREQEELVQLQALNAEKARLEEQRQKLAQAKADAEAAAAAKKQQMIAMAPVPKQPPGVSAPLQAPVGSPGQTWTDPTTGMEFVWVPEGSFEMGCGSWDGNCYDNDKPVHSVRLSGFWLGKYEVTQGQWQRVMGNTTSRIKKGGSYPVGGVSWYNAKEFISRLNGMGSARYRLPTEAEWEYAARSGGRAERYAGGDDIDRVAWYDRNSGGSSHAVGTKAPNGLGLYDMSGNVSEWCEDVYNHKAYAAHSRDNPVVTGGGSLRVLRGGNRSSDPGNVRAACRAPVSPGAQDDVIGFRLARTN